MSRQDVNIGLTGNDGTGDSIRDAFSKVNENFQELYASQGLEGGLAFESLANVIKPLRPDAVLALDALGKNVISKEIYAGAGITVTTDNANARIIISTGGVDIIRDANPTLSNHLDANVANRIIRLADPIADQDAVTRKWVYSNFLNRDATELFGSLATGTGSTMRQNFRITPTPNNGNANLGITQYIKLKAADGVTEKTDVLLGQQATDPAHAVRKDYTDSKISLQGTDTIDPRTGLKDEGFGTMTGPLVLSDHPGPLTTLTKKPSGELFVREDYKAATKGYVDARTYDSTTNLYVSTTGNDAIWDFDNNRPNPEYGYTVKEIGRKWATAFRSVRAACAYAKLYMDQITLTNTPYQVPVTSIVSFAPTIGGGARTRVRVSLQNHGYKDGDYVVVSGATSVANNNTTALNGTFRVNQIDNNTFELNLRTVLQWASPISATGIINISLANAKDGPYSRTSTVGNGSRGYAVPKYEITIHIETGVYDEQLPIVVPPNVALRGDEFRRTIIKPAAGPVLPVNQTIKYAKGDKTLGKNSWYNTHYYHLVGEAFNQQAINSTRITVSYLAWPPKAGMRFIFNNVTYRVGAESTITYIDKDIPGTDPGTYTMSIVDENGDPKPLQNTITDGYAIEFLLDNDHCDILLVGDAFQGRNLSFYGHKGFIMAFDPAAQILTRSPYAQVCGSFSNKGGGGQLVDGAAGNQVVEVLDNSYTDPNTGNQGARGTTITVTGLVRKIQLPNTFYYGEINRKRYVIIDATAPDANGTSTLTLSSTTPIEDDDTYLPAGYLPNQTTLTIQTAGNRSMLSNDFTMINDLGYGIVTENNGVAEAVSQFTYYCKISYVSRSGGQIRSVTGSSCYGQIGLQAEGSDENEAQQVARFNSNVVNLMTPYIDDPESQGLIGAVSFIAGGFDSKPVRNATFILNKARVVISTIQRARLSGGALTSGPLKVTTAHPHPFVNGDPVQITGISSTKGLQLKPISPSTTPRATDIEGSIHPVTVVDSRTFTLDDTDSTLYYNDLAEYAETETLPLAINNIVDGALETIYTIKGDPTERNFLASVRFDGTAGENGTATNVLQVFGSEYPAQMGMKFRLDSSVPAVNNSAQVYKVIGILKKAVTFKAVPPTPSDNKIGATSLFIRNLTAGYTPKAGWNFQLRDANISNSDWVRYVVTGTPTYDSGTETWELPLNAALTVNMVDQVATGLVTTVDGIWDLTLDRNLGTAIPNSGTPVKINFYNGYYNLNVDPALTISIPQAQKLMLFQQKSVLVHQVLDKPTIINSSALRFPTTNFDNTVYRILGKTSDGGLSSDVFKLAVSASPVTGSNANAANILTTNKAFLQAEAIAFLGTIYPDFTYNPITCYRDVGLIIDAVTYDLTYGGNIRSIAAGRSYYQANNQSAALVVSSQKPETVDAVNYVTSLAKLILAKTTLSYSGNSPLAVAQLNANKAFIQAEIIAWLAVTYPTFQYNQTIYSRDVGLIVDAVAYDLNYGGNVKTLQSAQEYYDPANTSGALILATQKTEFRNALHRARDVAILCITKATVSKSEGNALNQDTSLLAGEAGANTRVTTLMDDVLDRVLNLGLSSAPVRNLGNPRLYQNPVTPGYTPVDPLLGVIAENNTSNLLETNMNIIANIIQNGLTATPAAIAGIETVQKLTFPSDANMLIYGAVVSGTGIPANTIIRSSYYDVVNDRYIAKISNTITQSIPLGTEITINGPGYDFVFDLNTEMDVKHNAGDRATITTTFSTVRATGHDFLEVGTGGFDDSNYPHNVYGQPINSASDGAIVKEVTTGRVFHVSTDQNGNFRVGSYFNVNQGDGTVSISAKIGLTAVSALSFVTGVEVNQFSPDGKMGDESDSIVPTQKAIVTYIKSLIKGRFDTDNTQTTDKGLLTLNGLSTMVGPLEMGSNKMEGIVNSTDVNGFGGVNRKYVDNVFAGGDIDYNGQFAISLTGVRTGVLGFTMKQDRTSAGGVFQNLGKIDLNNNKISNVKTPTVAGDAANKAYVDQTIASGGIRTGWDGFTLRTAGTYNTIGALGVTNSGGNYATPPVVTITGGGGTGAVATATVVGGSVVDFTVETGGIGYTSTPTVVIGGSVAQVNIVSGGSSYQFAPAIDFPAPQTVGGVKAVAQAVINANGNVSDVIIINGGSGYTAAPVPFLVVNTGGASFTSTLATGSGATADITLVQTPSNINLSGNKITGSADPVLETDLVNWRYFDNNHWLSDNKDISLTGTPSDTDFLMFTGYTPGVGDKRRTMVNVNVDDLSDVSFTRTNNSLRIKIDNGVIVNSQVSDTAAIAQSKLNLKIAATFPPTANPTQTSPILSDLGISTYDVNQFVVSSEGLVRVRTASSATTGISIGSLSHVSNFVMLGRNDTSSNPAAKGAIVELSAADLRSVLNFTDAVKNLISDDSLDTPTVPRQSGANSYGAVLKSGSSMRGSLTFDAGNQSVESINPWLRVATDNLYDIGKSDKRFRNIYSARFTGPLTGNVTGNSDTTTTADKTQAAMSAGSWISILNGGSSATSFNGSTAVTIAVNGVSTSATANSIAGRDGSGNITAVKFIGALQGTADNANTLGGYSATINTSGTGTANSIAQRDGSGNLNAVLFQGTATRARYADLAENYLADKAYEPGTVLEFGGEFEVTIAEDETRRVAGVVSTNPAHLMNDTLVGDTVVALALTGRVPCKVRGKIRKGDMLVSGGGGYARPTQDPKLGTIIGKALEDFDGVEGVIEVVVGRL